MCEESFSKTYRSGNIIWYKKDTHTIHHVYHRTDGPAIKYADGEIHYYINGKLHNENGPAVDTAPGLSNSHKEWWLNGVEYSKEEFLRIIKLKAII